MGTTFSALQTLVLERLPSRADTATIAIVKQAINEAQKNIARVKDFDELMVLDTTNAITTASQKLYHIEAVGTYHLHLTRPKDIYTIRYMDTDNSRKLTYVPPREIDDRIPYTELFSTDRPNWYTRRGKYLEFFPIPNAAKSLYILYSQWPVVFSDDSEETPYDNLDDVIVNLASDISTSIIETGKIGTWYGRAQQLLGMVVKDKEERPDTVYIAKPFSTGGVGVSGEYWNNPFIKRNP